MKPRRFPFTGLFSPDLGIDLGTSHTVIVPAGSAPLLDEPSLVAVEQHSRRVLHDGHAVGSIARVMQGRAPDSVQVLCPIQGGVIADSTMASMMLRVFLKKLHGKSLFRPRILVAIPNRISPVHRQAVLSTLARLGVRQVSLISKSLAAALGAGLSIAEPAACMICDLGGGSTEIAVMCLAEVAASETLRVCGADFDLAITDFLRRRHRLCIGPQLAERIKVELGAAYPSNSPRTTEVAGRDLMSGLPRRIEISSNDVHEALQDPLRAIVVGVQRVLELCPADMAADLMENGIVLVGSAAQLQALDQLLTEATGIATRVAEDPAICVARGLAVCLENLDIWHSLIQSRSAA